MTPTLREELRDAALTPERPLDITAVRRRGRALERRRAVARTSLPVIIAVALIVGIAVRAGDDDPGPTLTDDPATSITTPVPDTTVLPGIEPQPSTTAPTTTAPPAPTTTVPAPHADGSIAFTDRVGDTRSQDYYTGVMFAPDLSGTRHPEPELDIVGGSITVRGDELITVVEVDDLTAGPPPGSDGGRYAAGFTIWDDGEQLASQIYVQRYNDIEQINVIVYADLVECTECTVTFDAETDRVTTVVPLRVIDTVIHRQGFDGLDRGDRIAGPGATTGWVFSDNTRDDRNHGIGGADADNAAGPGRSFTL